MGGSFCVTGRPSPSSIGWGKMRCSLMVYGFLKRKWLRIFALLAVNWCKIDHALNLYLSMAIR